MGPAILVWRRVGADDGHRHWVCATTGDTFDADNPRDWALYRDPQTHKAWWWRQEDGAWFWESTGSQACM